MQIKALICVLYGILFVEGTPFYPDTSIDLLKFNEVQEQLELGSNNLTLSALNSNETLEDVEVAKTEENIGQVIQGSIVESSVIFESIPDKAEHNINHGHSHGHGHGNVYGHGEAHASSNMGPVELGLRNVVSASGIATEELFMEMAALRSETLEMINTKSEILTSHTMNEIFKSLSMAEVEIKKNQECGRQFVDSFNAILGQVDGNLKTCVHNLTAIGVIYKNQSTQILSSISMVAEGILSLPEACEISENFALGTFCTVNNLAEANTRVVMNVKDMRLITANAKENISKAASSTVACHKQLIEVVAEKLKHLYNEVGQKCSQQSKPQNNEI